MDQGSAEGNGHVLPHNEEAEKSVLGAAMQSVDAFYDVAEKVKAEDFYSKKHQAIFKTMMELQRRNSPVDLVTVIDQLKKNQDLELAGGRAYVGGLPSFVPSVANAGEYAKIIAQKSEIRQLIDTAKDILEQGYDSGVDAETLLEYTEKTIFDIAQGRQSKNLVPLQEILLENMEIISERAKNKNQLTGVTTGLLDLDRQTGGLQRSDMVILAARPSMGKTSFALCVARNAAKKDHKVLIFSLEMNKHQLSQRLMAMEAGVDSQKLRTGNLDQEDWNRITTTVDSLSQADITIDDTPGLSLMEIKNKCRRQKIEKGLDLIVIDYLQLMNYQGKAESRQIFRIVKEVDNRAFISMNTVTGVFGNGFDIIK